MRARKVILAVLTAVTVAAFAGGVVHLFAARFSTGEMYPPYSSLRTDPLGTKALYEALSAQPSIPVGRNYQPLEQWDPKTASTLLYIGSTNTGGRHSPHMTSQPASQPATGPTSQPEEASTHSPLETFVAAGGRLVIAFSPVGSTASGDVTPLLSRLGAGIAYATSQGHAARKAKLADDIAGLRPAEFTWYGQCYFTGLAAPWRTIASCDGKPVLIERPWGKGSVVVSADSYFLSNEGLWRERQPDLLSWMVNGPSGRSTSPGATGSPTQRFDRELTAGRIVFDETHLGVAESVGISDLARRFRLEGLSACLVFVALLFVWKAAVPFLPRDADLDERMSGEAVTGRTSASGLLGLLRKSIPAKQLLSTCVSEWTRSCPANSSAARKLPLVRQMAAEEESVPPKTAFRLWGSRRPARQQDLASMYRSICRVLTERKSRNGTHD